MTASLLQWNIRGYRRNYGDLTKLLSTHLPISVCIQESLLGDHNPRPPRQYSIEVLNPNGGPYPGNGLVTLVRRDILKIRLTLNTPLQALAVRINYNGKLLTICNIYLHPNARLETRDLSGLVDQLPRPYLLLGDFNARNPMWGDETRNQHGVAVEQFLLSDSSCLLNSGEKTHFHVQTGISTAIDLSLCSAGEVELYTWKVAEDLHGSDHYPIIIETKAEEPIERESKPIMKRADWKTFECLTAMIPPNEEDSIDTLVEKLTNVIRIAASIAIPHSRGGMRPRSVPWWNDQCTQANVDRKRALRRYQRTKSLGDKIAYNRARAYAQLVKDNARKKSWQKYVSTLTKDTQLSTVWQRVNMMTGKYSGRNQSHLVIGRDVLTQPEEIATALADHFSDVSSGVHTQAPFRRMRQRLEEIPPLLDDDENLPYNEPIAYIEMNNALRRSKNSSPGEDKIPYQFLKKAHPTAISYLLFIYNKIWEQNSYPKQWRSAIILPFPKPGKPPTDVNNYRPIALTSCMGKLLERIIHTRLMNHLEGHHMITQIQHGFRRNRSTTDALMGLQTHINENAKLRRQTVAIFFDLQKAYDTIWRYGLIRDLHRYNIKGHLAHYICNFLTNRTFKVKYGSSMSPEREQLQGVPQGSVLSCALFILAMNSIADVIPNEVHCSLFVDDVMICSSSARLPLLERRLQGAVNRIERWATENGLKFSSTKTMALHFTGRCKEDRPPTLKLYNEQIPLKTDTKFLGMVIDNKLSWKMHLTQLKADCLRRLQVIKSVSHRTWGADRETMLRIYRAIVRAKLDYGCVVYQSANQSALKKVDPVHNAAIRLCTGAFRSSPISSLHAESGEQPLHLRRKQLTLQYAARTKQLPHSPAWNNIHLINQETRSITLRIPSTDPIPDNYQQPIIRAMKITPRNIPYWKIPITIFCLRWLQGTKQGEGPISLRAKFWEHLNEHHLNSFHLFTDGSKNGENVGCAVVSTAEVLTQKRLMGVTSVYTAELIALADALGVVRDRDEQSFTIFCDSRSAIDSLHHIDTNHPIIQQIQLNIINLINGGKTVKLCWLPSHVNIAGNEKADEAARRAASSQMEIHNMKAPARDFYPTIKQSIRDSWQRNWQITQIDQGNKLRALKDTVRAWNYDVCPNRQSEIVLCRLRIGHTRITHKYLMENCPPPFCQGCLVPLTVIHLLVECPDFTRVRRRHFPMLRGADANADMTKVLAEVPGIRFKIDRLMDYLSDCNLLDRI